jgi:hypothetical protein
MRAAFLVRGTSALALATALLLPGAVQARVVTFIDHFIITRGGIDPPVSFGTYPGPAPGGQQIYYQDFFDDGSEPPAGEFFASTTPAIPPAPALYGVFGSYGMSDECCVPAPPSKLRLDSSMGGFGANAMGQGRLTQRATLLGDSTPTISARGLKPQFHTFSIFGLFDLMVPPEAVDGYGVTFNDSPATQESVDLLVRRLLSNSVVVRFGHQDFLGSGISVIDEDVLAPPPLADQIELRLEWANVDGDPEGDAMFASYRYWGVGAPLEDFVLMSGSSAFSNGKGYGRASFFAVQAVPEPGTAALLFAALSLLAAVRRRTS